MFNKRIVKTVPVEDNWYPCFDNGCVHSILKVSYFESLKEMTDADRACAGYVDWRVFGAGDFYLEKRFCIEYSNGAYSCFLADADSNKDSVARIKTDEFEDLTNQLYAIKLLNVYDEWSNDLQTVKMNGTATANFFKSAFKLCEGF